MRALIFPLLTFLIIGFTGCNSSNTTGEMTGDDGVAVKFSGVKAYHTDGRLESEVTYVKGRRNGITKTYYPSGRLKQTINFTDGRKNEMASWFYEDGKLFRTTPYKNDTIHGTQIQYYKSGRIKARMSYVDGNRIADLEEYFDNNKQKIINVNILSRIKDEYSVNGLYKIFTEIDKPNYRVQFYRGDLPDGVFNDANVTSISTSGGTGYLELKVSTVGNNGYIGIIAEYTTDFGNKNYVYKKLTIPYRDVN
jgi:hypothetical protein